ncbi:unnamed protein product [Paramecium pentaurelia]|uniref:Uncharacterized protein n=1 Tax=Paramecium pentaurelia TaxID=43138 RepID=A0A8S1Y7N2_9CILI|nr:unnamed protein product [Paramecium pentaurelia]
MYKQFKRCGYRSKSLPRTIPLLVHKFINTRVRYVRRNAIKACASGPLEAPQTISRRKSCQGEMFGYFKSSKEWMQFVKIDNPQHRNQNLARIVFLRLKHGNSQSQSKRILSLKQCFKDQVNLLRILSTFKPKVTVQQVDLVNQSKKINMPPLSSPKAKLHTKLFHFNKSITIDQPLFPKKIHRNWSQLEMLSPQKAITQPSSNYVSPRKFKKSIMNIYGISNTLHLLKY